MDVRIVPSPARIAAIGGYQPRRCGIATFTTDLVTALAAAYPATDWPVIAMNDGPDGYPYPPAVRLALKQHDRPAYRRAATAINTADVDLVLVQHEYGIFGGPTGEYILTLLDRLRPPVVTTLHTILQEPDSAQRFVIDELARLSARLVVMSHRGADILHTVYGVSWAKIAIIPHGVPDVPLVEPSPRKPRLGLGGRPVMLTFGLLSPEKGIETVIEALPTIAARYPDFAYLVVGATHPQVRRHEGEAYRDGLRARAARLGVAKNLLLHDRFVELDELLAYIAAADLYITPYLGREQIASGTLAYTIGAGKAVISTPYPYAQELLGGGRGVLIPFGDSAAIGERVLHLLDTPDERRALQERAYRYGRQMTWHTVARRYMQTFREVCGENVHTPYPDLTHQPTVDPSGAIAAS